MRVTRWQAQQPALNLWSRGSLGVATVGVRAGAYAYVRANRLAASDRARAELRRAEHALLFVAKAAMESRLPLAVGGGQPFEPASQTRSPHGRQRASHERRFSDKPTGA